MKELKQTQTSLRITEEMNQSVFETQINSSNSMFKISIENDSKNQHEVDKEEDKSSLNTIMKRNSNEIIGKKKKTLIEIRDKIRSENQNQTLRTIEKKKRTKTSKQKSIKKNRNQILLPEIILPPIIKQSSQVDH